MFATVQGSWNLYVINCLIKNFVVNHSGNYGRLGEGVHLYPLSTFPSTISNREYIVTKWQINVTQTLQQQQKNDK